MNTVRHISAPRGVRWYLETGTASSASWPGHSLEDEGKLLKVQARLGHSDPSTTFRHYSHATPLDDEDIADELDAVLNGAVKL